MGLGPSFLDGPARSFLADPLPLSPPYGMIRAPQRVQLMCAAMVDLSLAMHSASDVCGEIPAASP
jgi:hypothetical protein